MNRFTDLFLDPKVRRDKIKNEKRKVLLREYTDRYQIMEYGGREYIAVNGKPVIDASLVNGPLVEAVQSARNATVEFLMDR